VTTDEGLAQRWVRVGTPCGVLAVVAYGLAAAAPLPDRALVLCAAAFGPLLAHGSKGLYHFVASRAGRSPLLQAAVLSNIVAGALVDAMLMAQLAIHDAIDRERAAAATAARDAVGAAARMVDRVQLGLDVAWDVYIAVGTFCFGLAMLLGLRGLGRLLGAVAMALALGLLGLNLSSFPTPPAQAGSFDLGPFIGLWYLVASIWVLATAWRAPPRVAH
jgi:hypothetical protein